MILFISDINRFFSILGIDKELKSNNLEFLNLIVSKMTTHIPWHNINMVFDGLGNIPKLETIKQRMLNGEGGICFETNVFMFFFLKKIGYNVKYILCGREGKEKKHLALLVTINEEPFFVDFGDAQLYSEALSLINIKTIEQGSVKYKIDNSCNEYKILKQKNNIWNVLYEFNLQTFTKNNLMQLMRKHYFDVSFSPLWEKVHFVHYPNKKLRGIKGTSIVYENNDSKFEEKKYDNINDFEIDLYNYFSSSIIKKYQFIKAIKKLKIKIS